MSRNFLLLFTLSLLLFAPQLQAQDWITYSSKRGKFKTKFPGTPEVVDEPKDWGKSYKAQVKYDDNLFFTSYGIHEKRLSNHVELAEVSTQAFAKEVGGTIGEEKVWKIKGNEGREMKLTLSKDGQEITIHYRVVLIGQRQYQVVVAYPTDRGNGKWTKKFFKSFKLL